MHDNILIGPHIFNHFVIEGENPYEVYWIGISFSALPSEIRQELVLSLKLWYVGRY